MMEGIMFDYWILGKELSVPEEVIEIFETEARNEFPFDSMMAEIHILRVVKAYAKANPKGVKHQSPGLRVPALPWERTPPNHQPQRGCTSSVMFNPVGVDVPFTPKPRVARIRASLG